MEIAGADGDLQRELMAMGAIIWLLMASVDVNYFFVLGVLLVSSIAGVTCI